MGTGIGIVSSRVAQLNVTMVDPSKNSLDRSQDFIANWCQKEISKERLTDAESQDVQSRIKFSSDIQSLSDVDFVIEAANEDFEIKRIIFQGVS